MSNRRRNPRSELSSAAGRNWSDWMLASAVLGVFLFAAVLSAAWHSIPVLPNPPLSLIAFAKHWAQSSLAMLDPMLFEDERRVYDAWWSSLDWAVRWAIWGRVAFAGCVAAVPAVGLARFYLVPRENLVHLRGPRKFVGRAAGQELHKRFKAGVKSHPDHEIAPGIAYPGDLWSRHVLLVAGVGAGKSTVLRPLIDKVVRSRERLFLFDPKSEFTSAFKRPALIAPWDARSHGWHLARDMRNTLDMRRFATAMVRDSQDPLWSNAARQVVVGVMQMLKGTQGDAWGWTQLAANIQLPQKDLLAIMQKWHPEAVRVVEEATVTTAGILINLTSYCASIFDLARAWGNLPPDRLISMVDWVHDRSSVKQLIVQGHGAYAELTKSYVEGLMGIVSALVNSVELEDDASRKIWIIADELPQMGKVPIIPLFELGRSRGVRCVVACQDFAQLEEIHGERAVRSLLSMCGTMIVGQMQPGDTAQRLSRTIGSREVERPTQHSGGSSASGAKQGSNASGRAGFVREEMRLYQATEFASQLGLTADRKGVKLLLLTGGDAFELFFPHFQMERRRRPHVPAVWITHPSLASTTTVSDHEAVPVGVDSRKVKSIEEIARQEGDGSPKDPSPSVCEHEAVLSSLFPGNDQQQAQEDNDA